MGVKRFNEMQVGSEASKTTLFAKIKKRKLGGGKDQGLVRFCFSRSGDLAIWRFFSFLNDGGGEFEREDSTVEYCGISHYTV